MPSVLRFPLIFAAFLALSVVGLGGSAIASVPGIDTGGLQGLLQDSPGATYLIDVRTPREFEGGHIPGSVLIPMQQIPRRLREIPRDKKVVVVCATGARSGAVTNYLIQNGYPNTVNYTGGVVDWYRRGLQLTR